MQTLTQWLKSASATAPSSQRLLLSLRDSSAPVAAMPGSNLPAWFLSGPEGGLSTAEEDTAMATGFAPASLGPRVLRAETAALAALTLLAQA